MKNKTKFQALCVALCVAPTTTSAGELYPLTTKCETALALSAAPKYVREKAGAYVLGEKGYKLIKPINNNYVCLVQRNSNESLIPQCFDKVGQGSHVPAHLREGEMMRAGASWKEIQDAREEGLEKGLFKPAKGHGVVYMASDYNFIVSPDGKTRMKIWPHVMYHAPNVSHEDIGSTPREALSNKGLPIIAGEGPLGYMIGYIERPTDSTDVIAACDGELPDVSSFRKLPPNFQ